MMLECPAALHASVHAIALIDSNLSCNGMNGSNVSGEGERTIDDEKERKTAFT